MGALLLNIYSSTDGERISEFTVGKLRQKEIGPTQINLALYKWEIT
jgi:hypothetical protein